MEDNSQNSSPNISGLPTNLTPMLVQYLELKRNHPDSILFYRMGDFYEMFFDDAIKAAPVLEVQLTSRDKNAVNPIPMCGVPYHAVSQYLQRLVARGFKVAICEQVEDPATAKGIVRREVTRVVTPALIGDPDMVSEESSNLLVSFFPEPDNIAVAILDLLSGTLRAGAVKTVEELVELFAANPPKEILIPESVESLSWYVEFRRYFPSTLVTYRSQFFTQRGKTSAVLNAVSQYLDETQKLTKLPFDTKPLPLSLAQGMQIDAVSAQALEIARSGNLEGGKTLFDVLNFTATPMGRRLLRDWLLNPLSQPKEINDRLDAVENLVEDAPLSEDLKALLGSIRDLERLTTKAALGLAMPRDLVSIRAILKLIPFIQTLLNRSKSKLLNRLSRELDPLSELTNLLDAALEDEPPATLRDGGIFRETYHPEIKECRSLSKDAKQTIAEIETRERERTGIPSLKIKFSRVFGYTIEITRNYLSKVPKEYHRKQTIANGERFITEELKRFEEKAMSAEQRVKSLEE